VKLHLKIRCIKCNKEGTLIHKKSTSKGNVYRYFYVKHYQPKIQWCYLGKYDKLPKAYKELFEETNQRQNIQLRDKLGLMENNFKLSSIQDNTTKSVCGCDLDWSRIEAFQALINRSRPKRARCAVSRQGV
jgi:hypothetical protein